MLDACTICESSLPYASPSVLVNKKTDDKRFCVDYKAPKTKDNYCLPRFEDQLDMLAGYT